MRTSVRDNTIKLSNSEVSYKKNYDITKESDQKYLNKK